MTTSNDNWGQWAEPTSSLPNSPMTKSGFGKMCDYLSKFIPTIFGLFQWFGADTDEERVCTLQYLGYKLYRALDLIKTIYENRGLVIRDEHCDVFQRFMGTIDNRVKNIEKFIKSADELLNRAYEENSTLLDFGKKRLISRFKRLMEWLSDLGKDASLKKLSMEKCEEWDLNHCISIYDDVMGDFRRQAYALLDGMILLSIPSHSTASVHDFTALYQNTLHAFCQSEKWQTQRDYLTNQIEEEYKNKELTTNRQKESHLKEKYHELRVTRENFLLKFDIKPLSISTDWGKGHLGRQLYEHLNNIRFSTDEDGEIIKMSNADLETYLTIEAQMQYMADEIAKLKKKGKKSGIFLGFVNEEKMSDCLYEVHQQFFGENATLELTGKNKDEATLVAFLFMVVEKDGLVKSNFANLGKKPFFDFMETDSEIPLGCTEKTFYNRLAKDFKTFHKRLTEGQLTVSDIKSAAHSDFQLVRKAFHGTKNFAELRRWKDE